MKTTPRMKRTVSPAKTECQICAEVECLTVGMTQVINGWVVTRWSENTYEVGTWGREPVIVQEALNMILS